jgi:hypothetical protein
LSVDDGQNISCQQSLLQLLLPWGKEANQANTALLDFRIESHGDGGSLWKSNYAHRYLYKQKMSKALKALPKLSTVMLLLNTTASTSAQGTCSRIAAEVRLAALKSSLTLDGEIISMWSHTGRKILQLSIIEKRRSRCAGKGGWELKIRV